MHIVLTDAILSVRFEMTLNKSSFDAFFRECERLFGKESLEPITKDTSVTCETQYSKIVPLENGEVSKTTLFLFIYF